MSVWVQLSVVFKLKCTAAWSCLEGAVDWLLASPSTRGQPRSGRSHSFPCLLSSIGLTISWLMHANHSVP